ncbi:hypothetical protein RB595_010093 [Gaeumannomyces hyphopodioides]
MGRGGARVHDQRRGPRFRGQRLAQTSGGSFLGRGSKVVLVSSESGSIALRHESKGGGGNYAHHASKAALNMVGRLLSLDLRDREVVVSIVHPGFMRTEMTKGVGFDKFWDDGGGALMRLGSVQPPSTSRLGNEAR